jgi:hypothetical protein
LLELRKSAEGGGRLAEGPEVAKTAK